MATIAGSTNTDAARIRGVELRGWVKNLKTRIPFRFGATHLVACPHLFLELTMEVDGVVSHGFAGDNLPPGWFDKSKGKSYPQQLNEQLAVLGWAQEAALGRAGSGFSLWRDAYDHVFEMGKKEGLPDLVCSFGASLIERALWDGLGRAKGLPFGEIVRSGLFGIEWGALDPALKGADPAAFLPEKPHERLWARHTVGLTDPLREADIPADERVRDGLPQSLEACLATYGNRYLKIKLSNDLERDTERLAAIAEIMLEAEAGHGPDKIKCTLDGNEQYGSIGELHGIVGALHTDPRLKPFADRILFIEQPLQRDVALDPERVQGLGELGFPMIIDESDATFDAYPRAAALGYKGTSHKNCKGVIKGLVNKARITLADDRESRILSAEDLTNIGPIALHQDMHVVATLGIGHLERNGHHYFRGLDHLDEAAIQEALRVHPGVYERKGELATLAIKGGAVDCRGLIAPGLGGVLGIDETWTPLESFDVRSIERYM